MRTFSCDFGRGVSCTVQVPDEPPKDISRPHFQKFEWTGKPGPWIKDAYMRWIHGINEQLSGEWNLRLMHVFMLAQNRQEVWVYHPGQPGRKVSP